MTQPTGFKLGKLAPIPGRPSIKLGAILKSGEVKSLPPYPPSQDNLAPLTNWQMLKNDEISDCVAVTWANIRRLLTARLAGAETYPDIDQVIALYKTQNPNYPTQDEGMVIQLVLEWLVSNPGPDDVSAVAFAKVNPHNIDEVKAAIAIFGYLWVGVQVSKANMEQTNNHQPWDYDPNSEIEGGHSVIVGGYMNPELGGDEDCITWGQELPFTDAFWQNQVDEAWVCIWPEHLKNPSFIQGIDRQALIQDYSALTGESLDLPPV